MVTSGEVRMAWHRSAGGTMAMTMPGAWPVAWPIVCRGLMAQGGVRRAQAQFSYALWTWACFHGGKAVYAGAVGSNQVPNGRPYVPRHCDLAVQMSADWTLASMVAPFASCAMLPGL